MLTVQMSKRRTLYVKFTNDTMPNQGGFYCQVYQTPDGFGEIGAFTINNRISHGKLSAAQFYATDYVKRNY